MEKSGPQRVGDRLMSAKLMKGRGIVQILIFGFHFHCPFHSTILLVYVYLYIFLLNNSDWLFSVNQTLH